MTVLMFDAAAHSAFSSIYPSDVLVCRHCVPVPLPLTTSVSIMGTGDGGTLAPTCPETFYQGYKVTSSGDIYGGGHTLAAFAYSQAKKRCEWQSTDTW